MTASGFLRPVAPPPRAPGASPQDEVAPSFHRLNYTIADHPELLLIVLFYLISRHPRPMMVLRLVRDLEAALVLQDSDGMSDLASDCTDFTDLSEVEDVDCDTGMMKEKSLYAGNSFE